MSRQTDPFSKKTPKSSAKKAI